MPPERLAQIARKPSRLVLGLMSGMSVDGLDLALVRVTGTGPHPEVELLHSATSTYPRELVAAIRSASEQDASTRSPGAEAIAALDFQLAELWARDVAAFLDRHGVPSTEVDVLGSHGQTLFHRPRSNGQGASTLQVGRGDVLAQRTGILTVSDFRPRDIAAGGEGAPLIPMADWILFGGGERTTACQNLGSIANVTVLPAQPSEIQAFDTGPANTLIDAFARMHGAGDGADFDRDGRLSAAGRVDDDALLTLYTLRAPWLARPPPKSAGYETFGPDLAAQVRSRHPSLTLPDLVRTAVEFSATTLVEAYERFVCTAFPDLALVRFSGGGCHNPTLMGVIGEKFERAQLQVSVLEDDWIDAKEAIGFALLADLTVRGLPGNVPSATGARSAVVLGTLAFGG